MLLYEHDRGLQSGGKKKKKERERNTGETVSEASARLYYASLAEEERGRGSVSSTKRTRSKIYGGCRTVENMETEACTIQVNGR